MCAIVPSTLSLKMRLRMGSAQTIVFIAPVAYQLAETHLEGEYMSRFRAVTVGQQPYFW